MSFWDWFKPKSKNTVVLPVEDNSKLLHGLEYVKAFTTQTEPKIADFPKTKYSVHWETLLGHVDGGYHAIVRFYFNEGMGVLKEVNVFKASIDALKDEVNSIILSTMTQYKR